ncbi:hypothetical protein BDN72DRAFT_898513, partial [Pluteus cervinus]
MAAESNLHYRLLIHLIYHSHAVVSHGNPKNKPDPTSQLLFTPASDGFKEAATRCGSNMLTATPSCSCDNAARILDGIAAICAPEDQSYATGLQLDKDSRQVILTISTNTADPTLDPYATELWGCLRAISSINDNQDKSYQHHVHKLQSLVFDRTLPKLRHRPLLPCDQPHPEFVKQVANLAREILKAVEALPDIITSGRYLEVQEIIMINVPRIIEEIRRVTESPWLWKRLSVALFKSKEGLGEWAYYDHFAKIAAFSTHTNALISAASSQHRDLFSACRFRVKIIRTSPPLSYTFPPPPTTQDAAQALVGQIVAAGDPHNALELNRQLLKYHVELAPEDDDSKVVVHSELGLLLYYLKSSELYRG